MTSNGRQTEGQHQSPQGAGQSDQQATGQTPPLQSNGATPQQGQGGPRVIRITHQTMEPVVMMQMNIDGMCAAMSHQKLNVCVYCRESASISSISPVL